MSRRRKSYRSTNIRQIPEPENTMVKVRTDHHPNEPRPEPPPPPPKRLIVNDQEIKMATTKVEVRAPKTIPVLQIGVATVGVSIDFTQDTEGSYRMWRFTWTACAFGWRTGGVLFPRYDLVK